MEDTIGISAHCSPIFLWVPSFCCFALAMVRLRMITAVPNFCHLLDTNYEIGTLIWLPSLRVAEMKSQDGQMCHVPSVMMSAFTTMLRNNIARRYCIRDGNEIISNPVNHLELCVLSAFFLPSPWCSVQLFIQPISFIIFL